MCNCKVFEVIAAIVLLIFAFWETSASNWVIAVVAVLLLIHALSCKGICAVEPAKSAVAKKRK
ncbi:hypothetical protein COU54_03480 [Candidatus Pacearchaeota archaeon CG10_big_fil_rev_8_21_14_0_10_31_24]|nr:MAG: hypothetical protein COU54_03480 [Candidatus Pacearchaeota archaeon CG10_big_fil_rev_8_21_14_0_10_31_24]